MERELLVLNGIDEGTGDYDAPLCTRSQLGAEIRARFHPRMRHRVEAMLRRQRTEAAAAKGSPAPWVDPGELARAGWGVIFPVGVAGEIREALSGLLSHRAAQAGGLYREYAGEQGYLPGDDKRTWLQRQGVGPGPADPRTGKVPYYLLIVGDPEAVPFTFQFDLGSQYAVGRLSFGRTEEYANYARSLTEAETRRVRRPRRLVLFGVENADDLATWASMRHLMEPLCRSLGADPAGWQVDWRLSQEATKASLLGLLRGEAAPALLLTTSHGFGPDRQDPPGRLGALLCQDWPGPKVWREQYHGERIPPHLYFGASDVPEESDLRGLIAFLFACFSVGSPKEDSFAHESPGVPRILGEHACLSPLACRLLGKPAGALAVIGHVDRARGFSFLWPGAGSQPQTLESTLRSMMAGERVGHAARYLSERSAEIGLDLCSALLKMFRGEPVDDADLADLWTASVDARSYAVLGDPASRLNLDADV